MGSFSVELVLFLHKYLEEVTGEINLTGFFCVKFSIISSIIKIDTELFNFRLLFLMSLANFVF